MISIITVSRNKEKWSAMARSFESGLGTIDLVVMDGNHHDLFNGYNLGAEMAQGETLIWTHDDVRFQGNALTLDVPLALLKKPITGYIGAAGTRQMPADGCWWKSSMAECRGAVSHPSENEFGQHLNVWPWQAARFGHVAVLDGVFLMASKKLWKRFPFAEETYRGFHFYDVDTTLRATLGGFRNYAAPIPIFHGSPGVPNEEWNTNRDLFCQRFASKLPYQL